MYGKLDFYFVKEEKIKYRIHFILYKLTAGIKSGKKSKQIYVEPFITRKNQFPIKTLHFILIHYGFWIALTIKKKICDQLYHANQNAIHKTLRNVAIFEGSNFFHFHTKNHSPLLQYHYRYFLAVIFDNEYSNFLTQTCILRRQSNMEYACHFPTFRSFLENNNNGKLRIKTNNVQAK